MARISLRPVKPLELEFADGTIKTALFNNEAFIIFTEEFGDIEEVLGNEAETNPYGSMAKILYCGMKVVEPKITFDEALQIMYMGGAGLLLEVAHCIIENFESSSNDETRKKFQEFLQTKLTETQRKDLKDVNLL